MARPGRERCPQPAHSAQPAQSGFTLIELLITCCIAGVLILYGAPALLNVAAAYKVHSSAQQLEMLGHQARYESIKLGQPVSMVADLNRNMFYVFSGTLAGMPPYNFPDGPGDIPAAQRVAVWEPPKGVGFTMTPACPVGRFCPSFVFQSDGSGTGPNVTFSTLNQKTYTVKLATPLGLGKLSVSTP